MYKKELEMKIIRTIHKITFYQGTRAIDILEYLKQVPPEAKVILVSSGEESDTDHMIKFELEEEPTQ
jgi:hypothetical protein